MYHWHRYLLGFTGQDPAELADADDITPENIVQIPDRFMNPITKQMTTMMMARYGKRSLKATFRSIGDYKVSTEVKNIRCPVLALIGAGEGPETLRQFDLFVKGVSGPASRHVFSTAEGADGHCQVGNPVFSCAVLFDWLDEIFQ